MSDMVTEFERLQDDVARETERRLAAEAEVERLRSESEHVDEDFRALLADMERLRTEKLGSNPSWCCVAPLKVTLTCSKCGSDHNAASQSYG